MNVSKIVFGSVLFALLLLSCGNNHAYQINPTESIINVESNTHTLSASVPLYNITHEDNFTQFGFTGSGSQGDPYILEGANLTHTEGHIIRIYNQSVYFEIGSCDFYGTTPYYGVRIEKSNNGIVRDCAFESCSGVYCDYANTTKIQQCHVDSPGSGIMIYNSYFVTILDNTINHNSYGLSLYSSPNCTIHNNTILGGIMGIYDTGSSPYSVIIENEIINCSTSGIELASGNSNITNNTFEGSSGYAINIEQYFKSNYHIFENIIKGFTYGISIEAFSDVVISNNTLYEINNIAITSKGMKSSNISFNEIFGADCGINTINVEDCNITNNVIHTFDTVGLEAYSDNCRVISNRIHHGPVGIKNYLVSASNIFYGNHLSNHTTNNAYDESSGTSSWDDGSGIGNYYNVSHSSPYSIPGGSGATDSYPEVLVDNMAPTITSPADFDFDEDKSATVEWEGFDLHPWNYSIYLDGVSVESGYWLPSLPFTYQLENLTPGIYNLQLVVWDAYMNEGIDEIQFTVNDVDYDAPIIEGPSDMSGEAYYDQFELDFNITDEHEDTAYLYKNGTILVGDTYASINDSIIVMTLDPGIWNLTVWANDTYGHSSIFTIWITTEDTTNPIATEVADFAYELGSLSNTIDWDITEYYNDTYQIERNGSIVSTGSYLRNANVTLNVDGLDSGVWNFTLTIWDQSGNSFTTDVFVTVEDTTNPDINGVDDFIIDVDFGEVEATWNITELDPDFLIYYLNDVEQYRGSYLEHFTVNFDTSSIGEYNLTIVAYDTSSNYDIDTVLISIIDRTSPSITGFNEVSFNIGDVEPIQFSVDNFYTWDANGSYKIYENGSLLKDDGVLTTNTTISWNLVGNSPGVYNVTLWITDVSGNYVSLYTWVTLLESETTITSTTTPTPPQGDIDLMAITLVGSAGIVAIVVLLLFKKGKVKR